MPVGVMTEQMSAREMSEWQAFFQLENWDHEKKPYPYTDEEIWGIDPDLETPEQAEERAAQFDRMFFGVD